jgi:hypothetical protein
MSAGWTIDKAVKARWVARNLDPLFKALWSDPLAPYLVLNDTEARANTPMPYCVYQAMQAFRTSRSTAGPCESHKFIEYITCPVQFSIHATKKAGRSAKEIAYELLGREDSGDEANDGYGILQAFGSSAAKLVMDGSDRHIQTHVEPDIAMREDDDEWVVTQLLNIVIERRRKIQGLGV